jgi:hypothetical protein
VNLPIPTRPAWVRGVTDKAALLQAEHNTFMEWRRRLSLIEETYEVMRRRLRKYSFQSRRVFSEGVLSVKDSFDALEIKNRQGSWYVVMSCLASAMLWCVACARKVAGGRLVGWQALLPPGELTVLTASRLS